MRAVVDTNVIAHFLLGTEPHVDEAREFLTRLDEAWAPAFWEAELANVLWMAARNQVITFQDAINRMTMVDRLGVKTVPTRTLWLGAIARSYRSAIAVYDTLFVELAAWERLLLATFDTQVLKTFGEIAVRPAELTAK